MNKSVFLVALLVATLLAGCGSKGSPAASNDGGLPPLGDKGAIKGIVIDDRYRPIEGALVLLTPSGLTDTTDTLGQFLFSDLQPGAYVLQVNAKDHEAAPKNVDVMAGQYAEVEAPARRIFSQDGAIITSQYSVFIDCAVEAVIYSAIVEKPSCTGDTTGDSARDGFSTDLHVDAKNVTYVVSEFLFSNKGNYGLVIGRTTDGQYDTYFAEGNVVDAVYQRLQLQPKMVDNRTGETAGRNIKFDLSKPYETTVFPHAQLYNELHGATRDIGTATGHPICVGDGGCNGVGVALGVKAKIVQSIFIGPPASPIETYALLKPAG
ncbi:MAG: carboxypeptidase-like regulatory domain-containing protein [bacterium]